MEENRDQPEQEEFQDEEQDVQPEQNNLQNENEEEFVAGEEIDRFDEEDFEREEQEWQARQVRLAEEQGPERLSRQAQLQEKQARRRRVEQEQNDLALARQQYLPSFLVQSRKDAGFFKVSLLLTEMRELERNPEDDDLQAKLNELAVSVRQTYDDMIVPETENFHMVFSMNILQQEAVDFMGMKWRENPTVEIAVPLFYIVGLLTFAEEGGRKKMNLVSCVTLSGVAQSNLRKTYPGIRHEKFRSIIDYTNWFSAIYTQKNNDFFRVHMVILPILLDEIVEYTRLYYKAHNCCPETMIFLRRIAVYFKFFGFWSKIQNVVNGIIATVTARLHDAPQYFSDHLRKEAESDIPNLPNMPE